MTDITDFEAAFFPHIFFETQWKPPVRGYGRDSNGNSCDMFYVYDAKGSGVAMTSPILDRCNEFIESQQDELIEKFAKIPWC